MIYLKTAANAQTQRIDHCLQTGMNTEKTKTNNTTYSNRICPYKFETRPYHGESVLPT